MTFTYDELEAYNKKMLVNLCEYYNIQVSKYAKKDVIIDAILEYFWVEPDEYEVEEEIPMSARVRRIREQNK